ncbi:MAG: hypothetical protein ACOX1X_00545 [Dethiobacteria bacterium]
MVQLFLDKAGKQLPVIIEESNQKLRLFIIGDQSSSLQSWVLGERLAEVLLESFSCRVEWEREHIFGIWMIYVPELDLWGTGDTKEEAARGSCFCSRGLPGSLSEVHSFLFECRA